MKIEMRIYKYLCARNWLKSSVSLSPVTSIQVSPSLLNFPYQSINFSVHKAFNGATEMNNDYKEIGT